MFAPLLELPSTALFRYDLMTLLLTWLKPIPFCVTIEVPMVTSAGAVTGNTVIIRWNNGSPWLDASAELLVKFLHALNCHHRPIERAELT